MPSGINIHQYSDPPRIRKLDLEVKKGELVLLLGDSGSGKSRLVRQMAGIEPCVEGRIVVAGCLPGSPVALASSAFLFQRDNFDWSREVVQQLVRRLCLRGYSRRRAGDLILQWCRDRKLDGLLHKKPAELNLEQVQLLSLAQVMLWKPEVVVLDEPLQNLSPSCRTEASRWIGSLRENASVMVTTPESSSLAGIADRTVEVARESVE